MPVDFGKILADSSRKLADISVSIVLDEPESINAITDLILTDEDPLASRAARVLSLCSERFSDFFEKQQNRIIPCLHAMKSEGVIRNIIKIVADHPVRLTKKNKGILLGLCFDWLGDLSKPVAIRVHAMQFLYNTSQVEAGIIEELISLLEENYVDGSMGFRSRADKILKKLYKSKA